MKKILLTLAVLAAGSTVCFAQGPSASAAAATPAAPAAKMAHMKVFIGKVESVSVANATAGTKSELVVADEAGAKTTFLVKATTTIYDAASGATTLDKIAAGEKVKVKYEVTKEGVDEAMSIHVVKA